MTEGQRWYVVQSQPNVEHRVVPHLERQGFGAYLPRYLKKRRHARRVDTVAAPLFPRYLFVRVDIGRDRWRSILSTFGVSRLLCNGEVPAPISDQFVASLKSREDARGFMQLALRPKFQFGDKVCILDGAFANSFGLYEGMKDTERVAILLDLLGRKVRVTLDVNSVAAA